VINSKSKVKDLAWEFIKIAASRDILAKYAAKFSKVCPRLDATQVPEYANNKY
jgi:maltose-binding protein MalE